MYNIIVVHPFLFPSHGTFRWDIWGVGDCCFLLLKEFVTLHQKSRTGGLKALTRTRNSTQTKSQVKDHTPTKKDSV